MRFVLAPIAFFDPAVRKQHPTAMIILLAVLLFASGCINRATATLAPRTNMSNINSFYVVHQPRDKTGLHQMISDKLSFKGYRSNSGRS